LQWVDGSSSKSVKKDIKACNSYVEIDKDKTLAKICRFMRQWKPRRDILKYKEQSRIAAAFAEASANARK
jgi:hypothetical protein